MNFLSLDIIEKLCSSIFLVIEFYIYMKRILLRRYSALFDNYSFFLLYYQDPSYSPLYIFFRYNIIPIINVSYIFYHILKIFMQAFLKILIY